MPVKKHSVEQFIAKLREIEKLTARERLRSSPQGRKEPARRPLC